MPSFRAALMVQAMLSPDTNGLEVFTDGSFDAGSSTGGWAYVVMHEGHRLHAARGADRGRSNNTFELMALFEALSWLDSAAAGRDVILWTDSAHVLEGCARWRAIWRNNGWRRIDPNPNARRRKLADASIWQRVDTLLQRNLNVTVAWCKAHSGIAGNDQADALAAGRKQIDGLLSESPASR